MPGDVDYMPKKGYNLGMQNNLRTLNIKNWVPKNIPKDVIQVDILYKESNSPNKTSIAGDDPAIEQEFWKSVEDSDDVDMYMAYLEAYPDGQFASLARLNITRLEKSEEKSPAIELEFWKTIKNSDDSEMFRAYLDEYPNGKFAPLARLKIKKLKSD